MVYEHKETIGPTELSSWNLQNFEHVSRTLGVVMERALTMTCSELIRTGQYDCCELLRDEVKPLIDALIHLDIQGLANGLLETDEAELPEA